MDVGGDGWCTVNNIQVLLCQCSWHALLVTGGGCGVFHQLLPLHTNHDLPLLTRRWVYKNVRKKCDAAHSRSMIHDDRSKLAIF